MSAWDDRVEQVWAEATGDEVGDDTIARIDALAAERGPDDARAEFERAGARDSAGRPAEAVELYRRALALGLDEEHRPQCVIQLASSLRNLGEYDEALAVIRAEEEASADGPYRDAVAVVHALILASAGRPHQGLSVALLALVPHLPRYHRSMTAYAQEMAERDT
ncbi:tetratricopeptide repeat protein [Microbacterium sp. SSW1-47]|uniref:tetratricopeptide repeat protein n=1 Tax=Microbacterium TaxID=33882 RepID=UPI001FFC4344|nr:tetratricopeptide repeat protein [Microbacterium sufflavum]MCK2027650.1 tetratricopeptide repeat protein [Microbacterium sufflavum]